MIFYRLNYAIYSMLSLFLVVSTIELLVQSRFSKQWVVHLWFLTTLSLNRQKTCSHITTTISSSIPRCSCHSMSHHRQFYLIHVYWAVSTWINEIKRKKDLSLRFFYFNWYNEIYKTIEKVKTMLDGLFDRVELCNGKSMKICSTNRWMNQQLVMRCM